METYVSQTLTLKGRKLVKHVIQSVSAITHSYTIQHMISMDEHLLLPCFVLKESDNVIEPSVQQNLFHPLNVYLSAAMSGKFNAVHFRTWLNAVYFRNTSNISDSTRVVECTLWACCTTTRNTIIISFNNVFYLRKSLLETVLPYKFKKCGFDHLPYPILFVSLMKTGSGLSSSFIIRNKTTT